jgi:hypothetical protein
MLIASPELSALVHQQVPSLTVVVHHRIYDRLYTGTLDGQGKPHGCGWWVSLEGPCKGNTYFGMFTHGQYTGHGMLAWDDGRMYVGQWLRNAKVGPGVFMHSNGDILVGEHRANKPHGHCSYTHADGSRFVGCFSQGKRRGIGIEHCADGAVVVAEWRDDVRHGAALRTSPEGMQQACYFAHGEQLSRSSGL